MTLRREVINSDCRTIGEFLPDECPADDLSIDGLVPEEVRRFGGRVTNLFLDHVQELWGDNQFRIFAWNTRLTPGHWPTPGVQWHTDGHGQESFLHKHAAHSTDHLACSLIYEGPEDVTTEFALGRVELTFEDSRPTPKLYSYGWWHAQVEDQLEQGALESFKPVNGELVTHDHRAFHRSPMPEKSGKRLLLGATRFPQLVGRGVKNRFQAPFVYDWSYVPREDGTGWQAFK